MNERRITTALLTAFDRHLCAEERASGTRENHLRHLRRFVAFQGERPTSRELTVLWKESLLDAGYAAASVNTMLAAVNAFFRFVGWEDCRAKPVRLQRRLFREDRRELTREEYDRLVETALSRGKQRLALLLETVCATGVRVSEVQYITVEAARRGRAEISLKGKVRIILLPGKLCRKLLKYAKKQKIVSGEIFLTRNGTGLSRKQIWAEMKTLCRAAGIIESKVFPHNLRHLFARAFYKANRDMALLADVLGHSSINTTRIYLVTTGAEHAKRLDSLGLVS